MLLHNYMQYTVSSSGEAGMAQTGRASPNCPTLLCKLVSYWLIRYLPCRIHPSCRLSGTSIHTQLLTYSRMACMISLEFFSSRGFSLNSSCGVLFFSFCLPKLHRDPHIPSFSCILPIADSISAIKILSRTLSVRCFSREMIWAISIAFITHYHPITLSLFHLRRFIGFIHPITRQ